MIDRGINIGIVLDVLIYQILLCMAMCSKHATRTYPLACMCKDVRMSKHLCMLYMVELWLPWVAAYVCIGADDTMKRRPVACPQQFICSRVVWIQRYTPAAARESMVSIRASAT